MEQEVSFEVLLKKHRVVVERYINFRLPSTFDADDVIQETYYAAYIGFEKLRNKELFKPWILSIARNQCNLWFRKKYGNELISLDTIPDIADTDTTEDNTAYQVLNLLPKESAELLKLIVQGYKQIDIAKRLNIPIGTVKSRLHYARKQFRSMCTPEQILMFEKGRKNMAKKDYTCGFPEDMPALILKESSRPFFEVKCADESFIVPIVGNKNSEGTYRRNKLALVSTCYVPKAAMIHEVAGVKIRRDTYNIRAGKLYKNEKIWFSQLTDEYIRDLATIDCDCDEDDDFPTSIYTFLEEDYDVVVIQDEKQDEEQIPISAYQQQGYSRQATSDYRRAITSFKAVQNQLKTNYMTNCKQQRKNEISEEKKPKSLTPPQKRNKPSGPRTPMTRSRSLTPNANQTNKPNQNQSQQELTTQQLVDIVQTESSPNTSTIQQQKTVPLNLNLTNLL